MLNRGLPFSDPLKMELLIYKSQLNIQSFLVEKRFLFNPEILLIGQYLHDEGRANENEYLYKSNEKSTMARKKMSEGWERNDDNKKTFV